MGCFNSRIFTLLKLQTLVQVVLSQLQLVIDLISLGSSLQKFDLKKVVSAELLGVGHECFDKGERLVGKSEALLVVLALQMDHTDVGQGILILRIKLNCLLVLLQTCIQLVFSKTNVALKFEFR